MKRLFLCASPLIFLMGIGVYSEEPRPGNEIRIYAMGGDIHLIVASLNRRLGSEGLAFTIVDAAEAADVQVTFVDVVAGEPRYAGASSTYYGRIEIERGRGDDDDILLHEMLHCVGVDHEDDPTSLMNPNTGAGQQLKPHHVEELRRLAGITTFGRISALFRLIF
jgi:hypothetical protein